MYIQNASGVLDFAAWSDGKYVAFGPKLDLSKISDGWYSVAVPELLTNKIQIKVANTRAVTGGIGEIEVWGETAAPNVRIFPCGANLTGLRSCGFDLTEISQRDEVNLWFTLPENLADLKPQLNINGSSVAATFTTVDSNGTRLGRVRCDPHWLRKGRNVIVADFGSLNVSDAMIAVSANQGSLASEVTTAKGALPGLTDGLRFTELSDSPANIYELQMNTTVSVDYLKLDGLNTANLKETTLWVWQNNTWNMVPPGLINVYGGRLTVAGGTIPTDKLKISLPKAVALCEITAFGSVVNQTAPRITLNQPASDMVNVGAAVRVEGFVDNAQSTVAVNGNAVPLQGHNFSYQAFVNSNDQVFKVEITAADRQGRTGTLEKTFAVNQSPTAALPALSCDLPERYYTREAKAKVKGTALNARELRINSVATTLQSGVGTYVKELDLVEGENKVVIEAKSPGGALTKLERRVVRDTQPPVLKIAGTEQAGGKVTVKGTYSDASPVEVLVNGHQASIAEQSFSYTTAITTESGLLKVTATDAVGNTACSEVTITPEVSALGEQSVASASSNDVDYNFTDVAAQYEAPATIDNKNSGPFGAWFNNNQESVSPVTGNLMIVAKDLMLPGRDGFDFELVRSYNSEKAQSDLTRPEGPLDTFGVGWLLNIPWINRGTGHLFLPNGQIVKIAGAVWSSPYKYDCHEGVHFTLEYSPDSKGYTLTTNDGVKYLFDDTGKITAKISANGKNTIHFAYSDRQITEITDSLERKIKFTYKDVGTKKLIQRIEVNGRSIEYDYDEHGLLKSVIDPMKRKTEYKNTSYGNKEFGTKYQNVSQKWVKVPYQVPYYCTDPVTRVEYICGYRTEYELELRTYYGEVVNRIKTYDLYLLESITYPTGLRSEYSYYNNTFKQDYSWSGLGFFYYRNERFPVKEQKIAAKQVSYSYQMNPEKGKITDKNVTFKNSYILSSKVVETGGKTIDYNLKHVVKNSGSYAPTAYPTSGEYIGPVVESSLVNYNNKEFEKVQYQYKWDIMEATLEQHFRGNAEVYRITNDYDTWGNLISQTDSRTGLEKSIKYFNQATVKNLPETVAVTNKNPVTQSESKVTTTYNYHPTYLKPETVTVNTGAQNIVTQYTYYENGNLATKTSPNGLVEALEYDATYNAFPAKRMFQGLKDADGKPVADIVNQYGYNYYGLKEWEMDGRGYVIYYVYDDLNRIRTVYLPDDDDQPFVIPSNEPTGNPRRDYQFDDTANTCEFWNENRQRTLYTFDGLGRLSETVQTNDQSRYNSAEAKTIYHYNDLGQIDYVTNPNNQTTNYYYDGLGRLERIVYPPDAPAAEPAAAQLEYDDLTNTLTVRQENGNVIVHKKDWADRLIQATQQAEFNGATETYVWNFAYDSLGNQVQQTNPQTKVTDYSFDPLGYLAKVELPLESLVVPGAADKTAIDSLVEMRPTTSYSYDLMGNKTSETDANGNLVEYEYDGLGRVLKTKTKVTRTNLATKAPETVEVVTKYYYDAGGNKVQTVDPKGQAWQYRYSARGFLLSEADPAGNTTQYRYYPLGNKIAVIDARNTSEAPLIWYGFNGDALVLKDDRMDKTFTTWYLYDDYNRLYRTVQPDTTPPANPYAVAPGYDNPYTETWYDLVGNKTTEQAATGQKTHYTYYPRNWVATVEGPGKKEAYQYDATGNQTQVRIWNDRASDTSYVITKQYDSLGRLRQVTNPDSTEAYTYDSLGNRITSKDGNNQLTKYSYNNFGWPTGVTDPLNNTVTYRYDPNGNKVATITAKQLYLINRYDEQNRVVAALDSLGVATLFNYDPNGNLSGKLDPRQTVWEYVYNPNNTLKQLNLTGADQTKYSVEYTYDPAGNRLTVSDTSAIKNLITYNDQVPDPLNRINSVERQFDGQRYRTEYEYNPAGQLTALKYPEATAKIAYQYNTSGQLSEVTGFTQPAGITYYDDGLVKNITLVNNLNTQYNYNASRRLQELKVSSGSTGIIDLNYLYDAVGNIKTMTETVTGNQSNFTYYENNWLKSEVSTGRFTGEVKGENGGTPGYVGHDEQVDKSLDFVSPHGVVTLDYDAGSIGLDFGELNIPAVKKIQLVPDSSHLTHKIIDRSLDLFTSEKNVHFTAIPRSDWTFSKAANGVITLTFAKPITSRIIKIHCLGSKATFLNELAEMIRVYEEVDGQRTYNYRYDSSGNRTYSEVQLNNSATSKASNCVYYANSDRLLTDSEYGYAYDKAGNLTAKGNRFSFAGEKLEFTATNGAGVEYWEYDYDLMNRLTEVRKNKKTVAQYAYDPEGLRVVKKLAEGSTTHYVFEGTEPIFEKQVSSGKIKSYVYALGKHLARVDGVIGDPAAKVYYYHTDHLGSIWKITDVQANVVWDTNYAAFGSQYNQTGSIEELHSFTGKELDPDTGLYYYNARWYDSELGRFVSEDPEADPNNTNLYVYCRNNPLIIIDPTGKWTDVSWDDYLTNTFGGTSDFNQYESNPWQDFLGSYRLMSETGFKNYLGELGVKYTFNEHNTKNYSFLNTTGQHELMRPLLVTDQEKMMYYNGMVGNIKDFLGNNPGLNTEQVKGLFDSAVMSANNIWGGENVFVYEGRGSNAFNELYGAETVITDQGRIAGVFTRTSSKADPGLTSISAGIYDYTVGYHHMTRTTDQTKKVLYTEIDQPVSLFTDAKGKTGFYTYNNGKEIKTWGSGTYKGLRLDVEGRSGINFHAGYAYNNNHNTGSEGCLTTYYIDYLSFMNLFNWGDEGKVIVVR